VRAGLVGQRVGADAAREHLGSSSAALPSRPTLVGSDAVRMMLRRFVDGSTARAVEVARF
jgi:hypothetical protein